jgi:FAD/FMN-containing dehydrogenase
VIGWRDQISRSLFGNESAVHRSRWREPAIETSSKRNEGEAVTADQALGPPDLQALLRGLAGIVGSANVRSGERVLALDPGAHPDNLKAGLVVTPGSAQQVAELLALCSSQKIAIVPHGGRTGLVGGGISRPGQIILSTARLNKIERLDPIERVAVVEAGVTLSALQEACMAHRLEPGIDLAARGSATIGGMVSTNAGGVMAFRNGVMRHRILGLEAVLADGTVYRDLTRVVKNAAGYDLKHLFIGSEGSLGIVTKAAIKLEPVPRATATALFGLPSIAALLSAIEAALDEAVMLRAAEALWQSFMDLNVRRQGFWQANFDFTLPVYLLLMFAGQDEAALHGAFERLFQHLSAQDARVSAIVAASAQQERALWRLREDTDALYKAYPEAPSYDVSVPLSEIDSYIARLLAALKAIDPRLAPFIFGHLADGNLHIALNRAGPLPAALSNRIEAVLYDGLTQAGGSISAEHGIGTKRIAALQGTADPAKLEMMAALKSLLDPHGILNPGKVVGPIG